MVLVLDYVVVLALPKQVDYTCSFLFAPIWCCVLRSMCSGQGGDKCGPPISGPPFSSALHSQGERGIWDSLPFSLYWPSLPC